MLSELSLPLKLVFAATIGGFISLDYVAVAQTMVSVPLVVGPIMGWLLGSFKVGLAVGVAFQLLWLVDSGFGAHIPPDGSAAAQISTIGVLCALPDGGVPEWALSVSALVAIPFALLSSVAEGWVRKANNRLQRWVVDKLEEEPQRVDRKGIRPLPLATTLGILLLLVKAVIIIGVGSLLCFLAIYYLKRWQAPDELLRGLGWGWRMLPAVGVGAAVHYFTRRKRGVALALLGLSAALFLLWIL